MSPNKNKFVKVMFGNKGANFEYKIDEVVMGSDWEGHEKFENLRDLCEVTYLPRTEGISTTKIKRDLGLQEADNSINQIPTPSK